jgi:hypothetical protein
VRDTCQDQAAFFTWKQVALGFSILVSRLVEARRLMVHVAASHMLRRDQVKDGRVDVTYCVGPCYHCFAVSMY